MTDALLPKMRAGGRIVNVSSGLGSLSAVSAELRARWLDPALDRDGSAGAGRHRAGIDALLAEDSQMPSRAATTRKRGWPSSAYSVSKIAMNARSRG